MPTLRRRISGWGRYPSAECSLYRPERYAGLVPREVPCIARGRGRSYGDASLNDQGGVLLTERVDRLLELDTERGLLRAEAGASIGEVLEVIVPRGWFLPVVPGTRHASLGGCVAADVHGKNQHHAGSFGDFVRELELTLADGSRVPCSLHENEPLFRATVGGMGLTGIISEITIELLPIETAWLRAEYAPTGDLGDLIELFAQDSWDDEYTVAWVDGLAPAGRRRGIASRAHHARREELDTGTEAFPALRGRAHRVPIDIPAWALNRLAVRAFNGFYHRRHAARTGRQTVHYLEHFFPLDGIGDWNRVYGRRGFLQHQCVLPPETASAGLGQVMDLLRERRIPVYLAVLKRFGREGLGYLSFAMPGCTLALDVPRRGRGETEVLGELNWLVAQHGGRVYLAKDACLDADDFRAMYPRYDQWLAVKRDADPADVFQSNLARRLRLGESP